MQLALLNKALQRCLQLSADYPELSELQSIKVQLDYVIGIAEGRIEDRSRLGDIIVGLYAAREFEDRDMEFANMLYDVVEIVDSLKAESS